MNFGNESESPHFEQKYSIPQLLKMQQDRYLMNPRASVLPPQTDTSEIGEHLKQQAIHTVLTHPMLRSLFGIKTYPFNDKGVEIYDWNGTLYWNGNYGYNEGARTLEGTGRSH